MAGAQIGALNVKLDVNTAAFEAGLNRAKAGLGGLAKAAAISGAALAATAVAGGAALAVLVKGAIDSADELSKAAQKAGVTTEALSRLKYAADYSDVSLEQLTTGLGRLSRNMGDIAAGGGTAAKSAFMALGISVTDATGQLRGADAVMADIAERFSQMENSAAKTALAQQLFGKAGADLIPLLNSGRAGLKAMADESDRLGLTLSTQTGLKAEQFNDTLTRVQKTLEGVSVRIISSDGVMDGLQQLADTLASPAFAQAAESLGTAVVTALDWIAGRVVDVIGLLRETGNTMEWLATHDMFGNRLAEPGKNDQAYIRGKFGPGGANEQLKKQLEAGNFATPTSDFYAGIFSGAGAKGDKPDFKSFVPDLDAFKTATDAATAAKKALDRAMEEGQGVWESTRDPIEQMQLEMDRLGNLLNKGAIDWDTYGRAVNAVTMDMAASTLGAIGQVTGALAGAFKDNKAFAVANAAVNTAEGITKALAQGGIFGFASAAAIGVAGAAQIATILSAQPGSGSTPSVAAPSGGDAAGAAPAGGVTQGITINLAPSGRYSSQEIVGLIDQINAHYGMQSKQLVVTHINGA